MASSHAAATTGPFFSIVLPTFNRAHLLPRAIASVVAQQESSWELIVVDDGSTDGTAALLHSPIASDARIRYITHSHRGLALSRAAGIALARGTFVTFLDSDDEYDATHLRVRRAFLESHREIEFLHGGVSIVGEPYVADKFDPSKKIHLRDCVIGGTFVVARELFSRVAWPIVDYGDDNEFHRLAAAGGARIATIDSPTYVYHRGEPDSLCAIVERGGLDAVRRMQRGE